MTQEQVDKRNRAEALIWETQRYIKDIQLDFGMQFAQNRCQCVETTIEQLREYLAADDKQKIDQFLANLQDALGELKLEVRAYYSEYADDSWKVAYNNDDSWDDDEDDFTGGSPPVPSPRRPFPTRGTTTVPSFHQ